MSAPLSQRWTEAELSLMREHYAALGPLKLSEQIGRTREAVVSKARELGVRCTAAWTKDERKLVKDGYLSGGIQAAMKAAPNKSRKSVEKQLQMMGIYGSEEGRAAIVRKCSAVGKALDEMLLKYLNQHPGSSAQQICDGLRHTKGGTVRWRLARLCERDEATRQGENVHTRYFPLAAPHAMWDVPDEYLQAASIWRVGQRIEAEARGLNWRAS